MADFFSRLAARALGAAPIVRPNLPSMFTPVPALEASAEFVSVTPARAANNVSTQPDPPGGDGNPVITEGPLRSRVAEKKSREPALGQPMFTPPPIEGGRDAGEFSLETYRFAEDAADVESPRGRSFTTDGPVDEETFDADRQSSKAIVERIVTRPAFAPVTASEAIALERLPAAPAVRVAIGRVEVRAVMPAPAAPRAVERRTPPLLSLEQYLRERNEARR